MGMCQTSDPSILECSPSIARSDIDYDFTDLVLLKGKWKGGSEYNSRPT